MHDSEKSVRANIDKNLDLLRTLYVISYIFGYRILGENFPLEFASYTQKDFVLVATSIVLVLLSVRLFWGVSNIRRYFHETIKFKIEKFGEKEEARVTNLWRVREVMLVHVPILLAHSFVFYLLCRVMGDLSRIDDFTVAGSEILVHRFIGLYLFLLILNFVWLYLLRTKGKKSAPEYVWMWNNFWTSAVLICFLIVEYVTEFFALTTQVLFIVCIFFFFVNSLIDYYFASKAYLVEQPG